MKCLLMHRIGAQGTSVSPLGSATGYCDVWSGISSYCVLASTVYVCAVWLLQFLLDTEHVLPAVRCGHTDRRPFGAW